MCLPTKADPPVYGRPLDATGVHKSDLTPEGESPRRFRDNNPDFAAHAVTALFAWYDDFD
jgi:hypothetical protein